VATLPPSRSIRRAYLDWVDEQIEDFKDSVPRSELLRLADEVVEELRVTRKGQYQLTELLLWIAVDRKIFRLLKLPGYRTWRASHLSFPQPDAPTEEPPEDEPPSFPLCV
jgi:hypothetical protein